MATLGLEPRLPATPPMDALGLEVERCWPPVDRGVVVGPCEDAAEKAPHKRCRIRFDNNKGTYVYTKGQQARRAPLVGDFVLGEPRRR